MAFANAADVEAVTGEAPDADRLDLLLEFASAVVAVEARQRIALEAGDVVVLPGVWGSELELPQRPVVAVSEVVLVDELTDAEVVVPASAYGWRSSGALLLLEPMPPIVNAPTVWGGMPSWGGPNVSARVTYDHGHAAIPPIVRFVTASYTAALLARSPDSSQSEGVTSETFDGSYTVSYGQTRASLPDDLRRLLRLGLGGKRLHTVET